jgi:hypothetical protein
LKCLENVWSCPAVIATPLSYVSSDDIFTNHSWICNWEIARVIRLKFGKHSSTSIHRPAPTNHIVNECEMKNGRRAKNKHSKRKDNNSVCPVWSSSRNRQLTVPAPPANLAWGHSY